MSSLNPRSSCTETSVLNTQEKLSLESWGLPSSIIQGYAEKGIFQMFPWQVDCLTKKGVLEGKNLVYTAPTSAGKTMVAEVLLMKTVLERKKKALFILPFVSVVREKVHYFQKLYRGVGIKVDGWMGSYSPPGGVKSVNVMIATIEKANNIINRLIEENKLGKLGCIVVDELHMLGDPGRGYLLELLLTKLKYMHHMSSEIQVQVVGMSATLPNLNVLARWLDAVLFYCNFRPIPLVEHLVLNSTAHVLPSMKASFDLRSLVDLPGHNEDVMYLCLDSVLNGHSVLIFCPSKNWCETLANKIATVIKKIGLSNSDTGLKLRTRLEGHALSDILQQLAQCPVGMDAALKKSVSFGVGFHHAGLTMNERDIVECGFRVGTLKVLVSTSTLSSGVNLPARRVILRSPRHVDILTYKQMVGRAGRMGKDSAGESYLLCDKSEETTARALVSAKLPPVQSCLGKSDISECLKRALLEVIACGVVTSLDQVILYTQCTLFAVTCKSNENLMDCIHACIEYLRASQFLVLTESNELIASSLARATLAASIPPEISLRLLSELTRARQCFVLDSELHVIYEITPYSVSETWGELDWMKCLSLWEQMSPSCKRVAELVGCSRVDFLHKVQVRPSYAKTTEGRRLLSIFKRFYTALALQDIVNEMSLTDVAEKYGCNKGLLQSLQQSASTFAGMVTQFCRKLGWTGLEPLVAQFCARLEFGCQVELVSLLQISLLNSLQARALYNAGFESLADIANASVGDILRILQRAGHFQANGKNPSEKGKNLVEKVANEKKMFVNGEDCLTEYEAALGIIQSARCLIEQHLGVDNIEWNNKNLNESEELTYSAITPTVSLKKRAIFADKDKNFEMKEDNDNVCAPEKMEIDECLENNLNDASDNLNKRELNTAVNNSVYTKFVDKSCINKHIENRVSDEYSFRAVPSTQMNRDRVNSSSVDENNRINLSRKPSGVSLKLETVSETCYTKSRVSLTDMFNDTTDEKTEDLPDNVLENEMNSTRNKHKVSNNSASIHSESNNDNMICLESNKKPTICSETNKKRISLDPFDSSDEDVEEDRTLDGDLNRTIDVFDANLGGESLLEISMQIPLQPCAQRKWSGSKRRESLNLLNEMSKAKRKSREVKRKSSSKRETDIWNKFRNNLSATDASDKALSSELDSQDMGRREFKILVEDTLTVDADEIMSSDVISKSHHAEKQIVMDILKPIDESKTSNSSKSKNEEGRINKQSISEPSQKWNSVLLEGTLTDDTMSSNLMCETNNAEEQIGNEIYKPIDKSKTSNTYRSSTNGASERSREEVGPSLTSDVLGTAAPNTESKIRCVEMDHDLLDSSFPRCTLLEKDIQNHVQANQKKPISQELFLKPNLPVVKIANQNALRKDKVSTVVTEERMSPGYSLLDGTFPSATMLECEIHNLPVEAVREVTNLQTKTLHSVGTLTTKANMKKESSALPIKDANDQTNNNGDNIVKNNNSLKNQGNNNGVNEEQNLNVIEYQSDGDSQVVDSSIAVAKINLLQNKVVNTCTKPLFGLPVENKHNDNTKNQKENNSKLSFSECFESQFPNMTAIEREINFRANKAEQPSNKAAVDIVDETIEEFTDKTSKATHVQSNETVAIAENAFGRNEESQAQPHEIFHKSVAQLKSNALKELAYPCSSSNEEFRGNKNMEHTEATLLKSYEKVVPEDENHSPQDIGGKIRENFANDSDYIDDNLCMSESLCKSRKQTESKVKPNEQFEPIVRPKGKLKQINTRRNTRKDGSVREDNLFPLTNMDTIQCDIGLNKDKSDEINTTLSKVNAKHKVTLTIENSSSDEEIEVTVLEKAVKSSPSCKLLRRNITGQSGLSSRAHADHAIEIEDTTNEVDDDIWCKQTANVQRPHIQKAKDKVRLMQVPSASIGLFDAKPFTANLCSKISEHASKPLEKTSTSSVKLMRSPTSSKKTVFPSSSTIDEVTPINPSPSSTCSSSKISSPSATQRRKSLSKKDFDSLLSMRQRFRSINETLFSPSPSIPSNEKSTLGRSNQKTTPIRNNTSLNSQSAKSSQPEATTPLGTNTLKRKLSQGDKSGEKRRKLHELYKIEGSTNLTGLVFNETAVSFCHVLEKVAKAKPCALTEENSDKTDDVFGDLNINKPNAVTNQMKTFGKPFKDGANGNTGADMSNNTENPGTSKSMETSRNGTKGKDHAVQARANNVTSWKNNGNASTGKRGSTNSLPLTSRYKETPTSSSKELPSIRRQERNDPTAGLEKPPSRSQHEDVNKRVTIEHRVSGVKDATVNETADGTLTQFEKANKYHAEFIQLFKNNEKNKREKDFFEELEHIDSLALSFKCVVSSNSQENIIGTRLMKKKLSKIKSRFSYKNKELILMYLVWKNDVAFYVDLTQAERHGFDLLSSLVTDPKRIIYLCNAKSTCIFLHRCCQVDVRAKLVDPTVADWLINPGTEARALRTIVKDHFKDCANLCNMFGALVNQPAEEALAVWKLRPFLESKLEQMNLWKHFIEIEMPVQLILARAELVGVGFQAAHISSLAAKVAKVMDLLEKQIWELVGRRFNLRSPKDWVVMKTKLNVAQHTEVVAIKRQWHQLDSLQSRCLQSLLFKQSGTNCDVTYLASDDVIGANRIHTQFSTYSQTGRIFTIRPNLQTTPKDLNICDTLFDPRNAFKAADGCVLICADFKQIELRVLTHLSQDVALKEAIESEDDVFKSIASQWHKIPMESVTEERRNQTKSICYAIIYGMGHRSLACKLDLTLEEAADVYISFKKKYAGIETFCNRIVEECRRDGYVKTLRHRRRYIGDISSSDNRTKRAAERQAVNTCIQGSAADIVKTAMIECDSLLTRSQCDVRLVLQVHDELIFEAPESEVSTACSLIRQSMEHCIELSLQLPVAIKVGSTWGGVKSL